MKKRTKKNLKYQFDEQARREMWDRDGGQCIFCARGYHMENKDDMLYQIKDPMHYINKSQGGLGVLPNGAIGCRYHHHLLDNGSKGLREEMLEIFKTHLKNLYPDWDEAQLVYNKWNFLREV